MIANRWIELDSANCKVSWFELDLLAYVLGVFITVVGPAPDGSDQLLPGSSFGPPGTPQVYILSHGEHRVGAFIGSPTGAAVQTARGLVSATHGALEMVAVSDWLARALDLVACAEASTAATTRAGGGRGGRTEERHDGGSNTTTATNVSLALGTESPQAVVSDCAGHGARASNHCHCLVACCLAPADSRGHCGGQ